MKRKLLATILTLSLFGTTTASAAFAENSAAVIQTTAQLKAAFAEHLEDGKLTEKEKQHILDRAEDAAVEGLVMEKFETAAELLNDPASANMKSLPEGRDYARYEVNLDDGCTLNVELWDRRENRKGAIHPMATSGSSSPWKEYGNRYFTAKATVSCGTYSVTISLENHYALSANGITERYGTPNLIPSNSKIIKKIEDAKISKATATTIGSSAGIHCSYSFRYGNETVQKYKMNTTVKYLAHNKTAKKIQVGQSWNLVRQ